jgi:DNA-binding transcriptional LysR family regulator
MKKPQSVLFFGRGCGGAVMLNNVQDIDLKLLRVFRTIVRNGGLVASQGELNVNLPTISKQVKQLEERLGVRLCERGSVGFRLTSQGEQIMRASDHLFVAVDKFRNEVAEFARKPVGELRLGIVDNLATDPHSKIPDAIRNMHDRFPGYAISFYIGPPANLESQVVNGELDIAIGLFAEPSPGLEATVLFQEEHGLYCAKGHALFDVSDEEIKAQNLLDTAYVSWSYQEHYISAYGAPVFNIQSSTPFVEGLTYLVLSGVYIGFLPRHAAEPYVRSGRLRQLLPQEMRRMADVLLIMRRSQNAGRLVAAFKAELERLHLPAQPPVQLRPTAA